jgi:hypothetical protein
MNDSTNEYHDASLNDLVHVEDRAKCKKSHGRLPSADTHSVLSFHKAKIHQVKICAIPSQFPSIDRMAEVGRKRQLV